MPDKSISISANVSRGSLTRLAKELDIEVMKAEKFSKSLTRALARSVEKHASGNFKTARYDGVNDVKVSAHKNPKIGWTVRAEGTSVAFIEYGAGVYFNGNGSYPGTVPARYVGIGQYGKGNGRKSTWWFKWRAGVRYTAGGHLYKRPKKRLKNDRKRFSKGGKYVITHGNPANACMYNAFYTVLNNEYDSLVRHYLKHEKL